MGNINVMTVPWLSMLWIVISPLCAATILCTIESPNPVPVGFVVKKGAKIFF